MDKPLTRQPFHQVDEPAVDVAQHVVPGQPNAVEEELGGVLAVQADLVELAAAGEAGGVALDDEQRHALGAVRSVWCAPARSPDRRGCRW